MRKIILMSALFLSVLSHQVLAFEDGDFQYRNSTSASWKVSDEWKMKLGQEFYWGDNVSNYYYEHTDLGAVYSGLADWVDLGFHYRVANQKTSKGWKLEHRPHLNLTLKTAYKGAALSNNSRLEFRMRKSAEDKMRYRNKTTIKFPWKWTKREVRPYIADEIFLDTESVDFTKNRAYAGLGMKLTKSVGLDVYYMRENNKTSTNDWNDVHVFGTNLKFSF